MLAERKRKLNPFAPSYERDTPFIRHVSYPDSEELFDSNTLVHLSHCVPVAAVDSEISILKSSVIMLC